MGKKISIKWKIFVTFLAFTIVLIAVLWFFQVVYLNDVYKLIKRNETENIMAEVENLINEHDDATEYIDELAASNNCAIYVTDSDGNGIYNAEYISNSRMSSLPQFLFDMFYQDAESSGGEVIIEFKGSEMTSSKKTTKPTTKPDSDGSDKSDSSSDDSDSDTSSDPSDTSTDSSDTSSDSTKTSESDKGSSGHSDSSGGSGSSSHSTAPSGDSSSSHSSTSSNSSTSSDSGTSSDSEDLTDSILQSDTSVEELEPIKIIEEMEEGHLEYTIPRQEDVIAEPFKQNIGNDMAESIIYVKIVTIDDFEYVMMVNSVVSPLDATVSTLKSELAIISLIMIVIGFISALAISLTISKSIIKTNDSAKKLAEGDYSVKFNSHDYKEIAQLSDTLNYAAAELGKTDALQKELIANVSHDLRTPLTMIKGYSEVMRDIPEENTPENVQVIIDETERLTGLVNDMLDISKLKAGTIQIKPEMYNFTASVQHVLARYNKLREAEGYTIDFEYDRPAEIYADEQKMYQVIYNLVNNAINYTGDDKKVMVKQHIVDNEILRLEVVDTGQGVSQEDIPYVWDRYYKDKSNHKRALMGTGLGLSIVKNVLELHGAKYGVYSRAGEGATFWFEIPMYPFDDSEEE